MNKNELSNWKENLFKNMDVIGQKNFDKLDTTFFQLQKILELYGISGLNLLIKSITDYSLISKIEKGKVASIVDSIWFLSTVSMFFILISIFLPISGNIIISICLFFIIILWILIYSLYKKVKIWIKEYENLPKEYKLEIDKY